MKVLSIVVLAAAGSVLAVPVANEKRTDATASTAVEPLTSMEPFATVTFTTGMGFTTATEPLTAMAMATTMVER